MTEKSLVVARDNVHYLKDYFPLTLQRPGMLIGNISIVFCTMVNHLRALTLRKMHLTKHLARSTLQQLTSKMIFLPMTIQIQM